jgi:RNA polymerase sigma-70 factor (ECF subfamily)
MEEPQRAVEVQHATDGDAEALQRLIVEYHALLRRAVDARMKPATRAYLDPDDLLQQAYVAAFRKIGTCQFDGPGGFYKWLEKIALNQLADAQRALGRRKRRAVLQTRPAIDWATTCSDLIRAIPDGQTSPSQRLANDEAIAAVMSCLARLSEEQRAVIQLRFLDARPVAEVAAQLGKKEAAIHALSHRGLAALREFLVPMARYLTKP